MRWFRGERVASIWVFFLLLVSGAVCAAPTDDLMQTRQQLEKFTVAPHRGAADKARDAYRHPVDTLLWFGIRDNFTVVEVYPGGGWYTDILAPFLKTQGHYIAAGYDPQSDSTFFRNSVKSFHEKISQAPAIYGNITETILAPPEQVTLAAPGSADMVLTFRNVHNWMKAGYADVVFTAMFRALKPGGVLGVVEHRANNDQAQDPEAQSGYVREDFVVSLAEKAGFQLAGKSEINANTKDTKNHPKGVWTLPPTFALGDQNRAKYEAIGESDRMTLKFVKPLLMPQSAVESPPEGVIIGALSRIISTAHAETAAPPAAGPVSADEIVRNCENKYAGNDQKSRLTIVNRNKDGSERKNIYVRFLKNYEPNGEVMQKMLLTSEFPPEAKGLTFMRWEYGLTTGKVPEQWLYTPSLRNVRRVSIRDPSESFLGTTLTLGDIAYRAAEQDQHSLLGIERNIDGEFYVVESVPKEQASLYSKVVNYYTKTAGWDQCVKVHAIFFDTKGIQLKKQNLHWQQVSNAWVWSHVEVENTQNQQVSTFELSDVEINPGLSEELFTERNLRKGS
jgi:predicted methyltransferase